MKVAINTTIIGQFYSHLSINLYLHSWMDYSKNEQILGYQLIKRLAGAAMGKTLDDSIEDKLKV